MRRTISNKICPERVSTGTTVLMPAIISLKLCIYLENRSILVPIFGENFTNELLSVVCEFHVLIMSIISTDF
jgi:hypothetical protein